MADFKKNRNPERVILAIIYVPPFFVFINKVYVQNLRFVPDLGEEIRSIWDSEKEEYYFSVVDVISALTASKEPRKYWAVLKTRFKKEAFCTMTKGNFLGYGTFISKAKKFWGHHPQI